MMMIVEFNSNMLCCAFHFGVYRKACEELVLLGFKHLDGQDVLQAPFKPSALVEAVFTVAPDGKFKGMKFKKPEISASLKSLVAEGRLFAVQAHPAAKTGGAAKYSSYPMAPGSGSFSRSQAAKMNSGNGKVAKRAALAAGADIVGGLVVGTQAVQQWPLWPSPSATEACNLALKARTERDLARAESEALLAPTAAEAEANAEAAQLREADRRYGSREVGLVLLLEFFGSNVFVLKVTPLHLQFLFRIIVNFECIFFSPSLPINLLIFYSLSGQVPLRGGGRTHGAQGQQLLAGVGGVLGVGARSRQDDSPTAQAHDLVHDLLQEVPRRALPGPAGG
jgi:hypothetical protein